MPRFSEEEVIERKLVSRFHKALSKYDLINDGDKILIGLSGGKDSLCLLELLAKRARIQRPEFIVEAVHVRMENIQYESDETYLRNFAKELNVNLHIRTTRFDKTADCRKPACFLCSWHRRKQIFNLAQELGCNKIALGHHMDDIIHTALMNMLFQGHFSTMPVKLKMRKMPLTIIRPLCLEEEKDIRKYSEFRKYEKQIKLCPYEKDSHRTDVRHIFDKAETINKEARYSIWNALESDGKLME